MEEQFLAAMRENPTGNTNQIYADWLEEQGESPEIANIIRTRPEIALAYANKAIIIKIGQDGWPAITINSPGMAEAIEKDRNAIWQATMLVGKDGTPVITMSGYVFGIMYDNPAIKEEMKEIEIDLRIKDSGGIPGGLHREFLSGLKVRKLTFDYRLDDAEINAAIHALPDLKEIEIKDIRKVFENELDAIRRGNAVAAWVR